MILLLAVFFLGFIAFPFLYACISLLAGGIVAKRYKASPRSRLFISKVLKKEIQMSMIPTSKLGWMNVLIQRMYHDMIQNYHFENGIRQNILKSFSIAAGCGLVRNIKIRHLSFGVEAPYLRHIRLISREEYSLMTKKAVCDLKSCAEQISQDIGNISSECPKHIEGVYSLCTNDSFYGSKAINFPSFTDLTDEKLCATGDDAENISKEHMEKQPMIDAKNTHDETARRHFLDSGTVEFSTEKLDEANLQDTYMNCTFMGHFVYNGCIEMTVEIELPKGVIINTTISVKKVVSDFLFRMPAENYTTRCEITLINDPSMEIEVESGFNSGCGKTLFQSSTSNLLKRLALCTIKNAIFYPCWHQIVQPFATSPRSISFYPNKILASDMDRAIDNGERIMAMVGCDFKIVSQKKDVFYRRSFTVLNGKDHISMWDFLVPVHFSHSCESPLYEGLGPGESKLLHLFETFEIFNGIIPGLKETKQADTKKNVSMVRIIVYDSEVEFIRVVYKSHVVFYKNSSDVCEFFVFRIQEGRLQIFSFTSTFGLCLNGRRVERLKKKVYSDMKDPSKSSKAVYSCPNTPLADSEESTSHNRRVELENLFKRSLCISKGGFSSHEITFNIKGRKLRDYLREDSLRVRMLSESVQIVSSFNESRNIKTLVAKGIGAAETTLHSLFSKKFIIDACPSEQVVLIYKMRRLKNRDHLGASKMGLQILYRPGFGVKFPNYFVESLRIRESYQKYFSVCDKIGYLASPAQMQKEICVSRGTMYFELRADLEDCFHLTLFSCKRQRILFDVPKVISKRVFRLIYPVENDCVRITLSPRYKKNETIWYKIESFPYPKNILVDGVLRLDCNCKFEMSIEGSHAHVIFWEKEWGSELKSYICDNANKTAVSNCGILRSEEKAYTLTHKNKNAKETSIQIFAGLTELC